MTKRVTFSTCLSTRLFTRFSILSIFLLFLFSLFFFESSYAKYVFEEVYTVANIHIDRCAPTIEMISANCSDAESNLCISDNTVITIRIKVVEKNISVDNLSFNNLVITVGGNSIKPALVNNSVVSGGLGEKIYEFSFSHVTGSGTLKLQISKGLIEDISGLKNEAQTFSTGIWVHNKK